MIKDAILTAQQNEDELIRQAQLDPEAFKPIYEKYFKRLFLFVLHRIGEKELSADLTQQVFLKALGSLAKFKIQGAPFSAWLYRIAINECNDYFRKSKHARLVVLQDHHLDLLFEELTAENTVDELKKRLPSILSKLNAHELQLIQLRFFEERPFKEIGNILGTTENNSKVKTYRILEKMKKLFLAK